MCTSHERQRLRKWFDLTRLNVTTEHYTLDNSLTFFQYIIAGKSFAYRSNSKCISTLQQTRHPAALIAQPMEHCNLQKITRFASNGWTSHFTMKQFFLHSQDMFIIGITWSWSLSVMQKAMTVTTANSSALTVWYCWDTVKVVKLK